MATRKLIVVSEAIDKSLTNIYNAALKLEGLQMIACVNAVKQSVIEESLDNEKNRE